MKNFSLLLLGACFLTASGFAQKVKPATKGNDTKVVGATKTSTEVVTTTVGISATDAVNPIGVSAPMNVVKVLPSASTGKGNTVGKKKAVIEPATQKVVTTKPKEETIPVLMTADPVK